MVLKLPRLSHIQIADKAGNSTREFERFWDQVCAAIEDAFNQLSDAVDAIEAAQTAATAAQAAADAAQTAADTAQAAADAAQSSTDDLGALAQYINAKTIGCTISSTDAGSDVTVHINAHQCRFGDGTTVSVNAGVITGVPYGTASYIFYDDASQSGGAVSYNWNDATTKSDSFPSTTNPHRVSVGIGAGINAADPPTPGTPNEL